VGCVWGVVHVGVSGCECTRTRTHECLCVCVRCVPMRKLKGNGDMVT